MWFGWIVQVEARFEASEGMVDPRNILDRGGVERESAGDV